MKKSKFNQEQQVALRTVAQQAATILRQLPKKKNPTYSLAARDEFDAMVDVELQRKRFFLPTASGISNIEERADGYCLGRMIVAGVDFHAQFIRVHLSRHDEQVCDSNDDVATNNWDVACCLYDGAFQTITIPGMQGEWVCIIHPYGK
jgi:hypothetical protein